MAGIMTVRWDPRLLVHPGSITAHRQERPSSAEHKLAEAIKRRKAKRKLRAR